MYYGTSTPLGSGKTTAAIKFAGYAARSGEKIVIAQPSIRLIEQSLERFMEIWPKIKVAAIHGDDCCNVSRKIKDHTTESYGGEVLFVTHAGLIQTPYWHDSQAWHLIVDEAPQVFYHVEITLPDNPQVLLPALGTEPSNVRYHRLNPGDATLLDSIAANVRKDQVNALFRGPAQKLTSPAWNLFVLAEQWERFRSGKTADGKLSVFGLLKANIFDRFPSCTLMSANLERTTAYQHLVQHGHVFHPHQAIDKELEFRSHSNGATLTIHYATENMWSKQNRNRTLEVAGEVFSVNDLIVRGALDVFDGQDFVWVCNKDVEENSPFGGHGVQLPHSPHGLNNYRHIHNAAILPALNPTPSLYAFLDEVAGLSSDEVRRGVYHEAVYQAAGRISTRNPST